MIHPTAIIGKDVRIGECCNIGPFCIVEGNTVLGDGNSLISHVRIEGNTSIGEGNTFHPSCVIGAIPQDLKYKNEETGVRIGSHNTFRECVTINRGTVNGAPLKEGVTVVGNHCLIMAYTHIAHDCVLENHVVIANGTQLAGHVVIEDYARLGGVNLLVQNVRIGSHAFLGAGVTVRKDVPPYVIGGGDPIFKASGINKVGLQRKQFSNKKIQSLKEVFRNFYCSKNTVEEALLKIKSSHIAQEDEVQKFIRFVETSEIGVHR